MSLWSEIRVAWQAFKTRRKMNRQFGKREDPFSYATTPYEAARLAAMDAALGAAPLGPVLEAGCAEGHFTETLARRSSRVLALDISAVALERARRRAPRAVPVEADLMTWEPRDEAPFDAIVIGDVLYYLDRPGVSAEFAALFPRIASWLRPGGRLLLAHGFSSEKELAHRRSFRERFEAAGLRLVSEAVPDADRGGVRCLLSALEKI
ncbi:MAG: class I SAM-dependent methyltransferase [Elusimicrobia bacterium]|nr:class I SAM-dependent methyltransferase [Elusimicrobiota bacterium]